MHTQLMYAYAYRLAVGTEMGLIVVDTKENMLVEVIGSEKKLLSTYVNDHAPATVMYLKWCISNHINFECLKPAR